MRFFLYFGDWSMRLTVLKPINCAELRSFWKLNHFRLTITVAVAITSDIYTFAVYFLRQASTNITSQYL